MILLRTKFPSAVIGNHRKTWCHPAIEGSFLGGWINFEAGDKSLTPDKSFLSKITHERFPARVVFLDGHLSFSSAAWEGTKVILRK
ncbi:hypothetical protein [Pararhizobium sp. DWP3-4]|uniref:hypothetical protein n=1 Tax=Pararhizobium sp. DWP3-4 TaxID=2804565 RepID=UPI003CF1440E